MATINAFNRIIGLLDEIAIQGDKIEDVASKTDILSNVSRLFADLGAKTKDYSLIEKALTYASNITYDYRRVTDKIYIGRLMHKFGKKINALNLTQVAESSSKRIKDLTLKINAMLKIAELREILGEHEDANDLYERSITTIEISSNTLIVKVDAYLSAYKFFMNVGNKEQASPILDLIFKFLEENTDPSIESQILRSVINTIITISQKTSKEPLMLLSDALKMLDEFQSMDDIDLIYNDIIHTLKLIKHL
jgi:regulator of replication initiation timing